MQVHEIGYEHCTKSYVFRGSKEVTGQMVQDMLGIAPQQRGRGTAQQQPGVKEGAAR